MVLYKFDKFTEKLYESLPRQSTVDQLHRIRDEIKKAQNVKIGPEIFKMAGGDVGDRVIDDLVSHKGKQEMNNLFWWDNPLDRYICSYEDFVKNDARQSLGCSTDGHGDTKPHPTDIPEKDPQNMPKQNKKIESGLDIIDGKETSEDFDKK